MANTSKPNFGIEQPFDYDLEFCEGFVFGKLEEVSQAFAKLLKASKVVLARPGEIIPVKGQAYYLIQHQGENWVRFLGPFCHFIYFEEAMTALSKILKTKSIFWFFEDTSCSYGYNFFIGGKRIESLEVPPDEPCVFKSRLPGRASLKIRPGSEESFIGRFFKEQQVYVRLGYEWEISKGVSILKGPMLKSVSGVYLVEVLR